MKPPATNKQIFTIEVTPENDSSRNVMRYVKVCLLLIIITVISFNGVLQNDFITYDDNGYITQNIHVQKRLTPESIKWAFTTFTECNWHPLTWLSHMVDVQLFGLNPAAHHFMNLCFHVIATILLFGFLYFATKKIWLSAFVAALFAVHPLHVQSVAWAAERKDILSSSFFFATLWAYVFYTRRQTVGRYVLILILFTLGLLAKPMLVSLPFMLLLLDYWPLERLTILPRAIGKLLLEKMPFFILAASSSIITIIAQQRAFTGIPFSMRIANAIISYCVYIRQLFFPANLAVYYPYDTPNFISVAACAVLLITITVMVLWIGRRNKYLFTGWLWYIVTLVPVIGILQVGSQAHADRYTYIPFVGLFIMAAWGLNAISNRLKYRKKTLVPITSIAILLFLSAITWQQVRYWKNDITLFTHALDVTKNNVIAHRKLCDVFEKNNQFDEALRQYQELSKFYPQNDTVQFKIGYYLSQKGKNEEAINHLRIALRTNPNHAAAHYTIANILLQAGQTDEAIAHYKKALEIKSDYFEALCNLAGAYYQKQQPLDAMPLMQRALAIAKASGDESKTKVITENLGRLNQAIRSIQQ
jgi:protein O-mannosyl-transferase